MELLVGKMVRLEKLRFPEVKEPGQAKDYQVLSGRAQLVVFFSISGGFRSGIGKKVGWRAGSGRVEELNFLIRYFRVPYLLSGISRFFRYLGKTQYFW